MVNGQLVHKTAHIGMPTLVLAASPTSGHPGVRITFTPSWTDGTALTGSVDWQWTPDSQPIQTSACGFSGWNFVCTTQVYESGMMTVILHFSGSDYRATSPHVLIYTNFTLDADRSSVVAGDTVTFTPKYDGVPGPAARWKWVPSDTASHDFTACADGVWPCQKAMVASGTMWAYTGTTAGEGDSASAPVTVRPPSLSVTASPDYAYSGDTVAFAVSSSDGPADVISWTWTDDPVVLANRIGPIVGLVGSGNQRSRNVRPFRVSRARSSAGSPLFSVETNVSCAAHVSICDETVVSSGVMHVRAIVHGVSVEDSAHVTIADLDNLSEPPPDIAQPDGNGGVGEPPPWCPTDPKVYLQSSIVRSRMKLLYDSTALEHLEHGSFVFADSVTSALRNGPVIEGDTTSVPGMNPPPSSACVSIHAHPDGTQYQLGPSGPDQFYSSKWHLAGFMITKDYVFYMDTDGRARAIARRTG